MASKLSRLSRFVSFKVRQRLSPPKIGNGPWFKDPAAVAFFNDQLSRSSRYIEYGAGGSTVLAARLGTSFVSVETDAFYCSLVRKKVGSTNGHIVYADIGLTEEYGVPLIGRATPRRIAKWRNYAETPWKFISDPDLVLIDGRFRVLCAVTCIARMRRDAVLVFDNFDRGGYQDFLTFAEPVQTFGSTVAFRPKLHIDENEVNSAKDRFATASF